MASPAAVWLLMLGLFAFICRKKTAVESLLIYTAVLVATSPATTNQYFAIPVAFAAVYINLFTIGFTIASTYHLCVDLNGLHLQKTPTYYGDLGIYALSFAIVWIFWRQNILSFIQKCREEIRIQTGP
jgi:hypothetical protein